MGIVGCTGSVWSRRVVSCVIAIAGAVLQGFLPLMLEVPEPGDERFSCMDLLSAVWEVGLTSM